MTHDPTPRLERRDSFVHRVSDSIRYRDQDPGGHVNNTAFSHFVESGRVAYNLDCIARGEGAGARFTVARVAIDYRAEARHPGTVETGTRVLAVGARSYVVGSGLFVGDTCIATAESVTVHLRDGRPAVMPEPLRRRLEGLPLDAAMPARPAPPRRFMPHAKASVPAPSPSASGARRSIRWRSRTTSRCSRPTARNLPPRSSPM